MSTNKHIDKICIIIIICALIVTALFINGEKLGITKIVDADAENNSDSVWFTANDLDADRDTEGACVINLNGDEIGITGSGAYANDGSVTIAAGGTYVFSGTLTDGSIIVDAYDSSKVWLLFDGVEISCSDDAALRVEEADKVFLTLAEGSENILASGPEYSEEALADGTDGAIFAHDDLTINGSGSLTVTAEYRHGIAANDDLVITGGTITVEAVQDAIHANDSLRICGADITVTAGDDGLATSNEEAYFYMESGSLKVTSGDDGLHMTGDVTIAGGDIEIAAGDDGIHSDTAAAVSGGTILVTDCYEGIEAVTVDIEGGDITICPEDDGLNANGGSMSGGGMGEDMRNMGGEFAGSGEMPEPPEDGELPEMSENGEMPEDGELPEMSEGGEMPEMPEDGERPEPPEDGERPGMNGTGDMRGGRPDMQGQMAEEGSQEEIDSGEEASEAYIHISGGTLTIINDSGRDADGIDSNGDILISGGVIRVSLTGSGGNNAIDSAGECRITGGEIIACGGSAMAEGFDSSSTQCSVMYNLSSTAEAGTTLALEDANGKVMLSYEVPCSFTSAIISCPEIQTGETYTICIGDSQEEITPDEAAASFGDAQGGLLGGNMSREGMQQGELMDGFGNDPSPGSEDGQTGSGPAFETDAPRNEENSSVDVEETVSGTALSEFSSETYLLLGICAAVIAAGLLTGIIYRRRR